MALAAGFCVAACDKTVITPTQVMVYVTADEALSQRISSVRVSVLGDESPVTVEPDEPIDQKPVRVALVPQDGDASRTFMITATLLDAVGASLGTQTAMGGYIEEEFREVWLEFDATCEHKPCEDGYRCQKGRCVEYCVEPRPEGNTEPSEPVACSDPCEQDACADDRQLACEDGARILEQVCGVGCNATTQKCGRITPSAFGAGISTSPALMNLVVGTEQVPNAKLFATGPGMSQIFVSDDLLCGPEVFGPCDADTHGIRYELVEEWPFKQAVFAVSSLTVLEGATLSIHYADQLTIPLSIVSEGDIVIEGTINVSGVAPFPLALPGNGDPDVLQRGGGGGSFGGLGGTSGGGSSGGAQYCYEGFSFCDESLFPLLPGSHGGGSVGRGGGAIQLVSVTGKIIFRGSGLINAGGAGGGVAGFGIGGGGGGSGGAILLEAGTIECPAQSSTVFFGAPGGGGGGHGSAGAAGHPRFVPAPGGAPEPNTAGQGAGGAGSDAMGQGGDALPSATWRGGGGGGAGRVRINTAAGGPIDCGTILEPTSFGEVAIEDGE